MEEAGKCGKTWNQVRDSSQMCDVPNGTNLLLLLLLLSQA